jgi:hypothetical protein
VVCEGQEDALRFVLKPGGKAEHNIYLENRSDKPITIIRIESSCDCSTAKNSAASSTFAPYERKWFRVSIDMGKDVNYVGAFAPELRLRLSEERELIVSISVEVCK